VRNYIEDACEEIDESVFTGDAFRDPQHRRGLREYMARWERQLKVLDEIDEEDNTDNEPKISMSAKSLLDCGKWDIYCEWSGTSVWAINEGQMSSDEIVSIPLSVAKVMNLC